MKMTLYRLSLPLAHEFTIARGSIDHQDSLVVELEHDGFRGYGEVTSNSYYQHTVESIEASLELARPELDAYLGRSPEVVWPEMKATLADDHFALSALDMAAHDLHGRMHGLPTYQDWGLEWKNIPESSFTIGIDRTEVMVEKLNEKPGWSIYKIKLGTPRDLEIISELRRHTDSLFRVDANCGWSVEEAIENSRQLANLKVEFIEQPLPADASREDQLRLFENSALPLIADENCMVEEDVEKCRGRFHGVNVKLCKCGGLTPALRMLKTARQHGLKTMVGCMIESSIGISAAAHLLPLLDYADLDGAELLRQDPATGVSIERGKVMLFDGPGTGAGLRV